MPNSRLHQRTPGIDGLDANRHRVSVHKYGFFLCRRGSARVLLGERIYAVAPEHLCIYAPNTFFRILEKSDDLDGILMEDEVSAYYPAVSSINIRKRLSMRENPVVVISRQEADSITALADILDSSAPAPADATADSTAGSIRENYMLYLRYALCLKVCEAYFSHRPVTAMPQEREDVIFNKFLISLFDHCHEERTVRYYASEQHLSPYYFSNIIRGRSGKSVMQWIENVTMTYARQYLNDPSRSIKEIAETLSFPDQSSFGRYFRHRQGCSPTQYRLRAGANTPGAEASDTPADDRQYTRE